MSYVQMDEEKISPFCKSLSPTRAASQKVKEDEEELALALLEEEAVEEEVEAEEKESKFP